MTRPVTEGTKAVTTGIFFGQPKAEALGFRRTIEKPVLDGAGGIDLLLERGGDAIACEISISTTIDHEVGNVEKCLKAGFERVAVICLDERRMTDIAKAVVGSLGQEPASKVSYSMPDQFITFLRNLPPPASPTPEPPEILRGYRIKRSVSKLTSEEKKVREEAALRSIAESMRKAKRPK